MAKNRAGPAGSPLKTAARMETSSVGAILRRTAGVARGYAGPPLGRLTPVMAGQPKVALTNRVAYWLTRNSVSAASWPTRNATLSLSTFCSSQSS